MKNIFAALTISLLLPFSGHAQEQGDAPSPISFTANWQNPIQLKNGLMQFTGFASIGPSQTGFTLFCGYNKAGILDPNFEQLTLDKENVVYQLIGKNFLIMRQDPLDPYKAIITLQQGAAEITKRCNASDDLIISDCASVTILEKMPKEILQNPRQQIEDMCWHHMGDLLDPIRMSKFNSIKAGLTREHFIKIAAALGQ